MKIERAGLKKIEEANDLPDMSNSVRMFFQKIKIDLIRKTQVDGYTQETKRCINTMGVRQAFTPDQLMLKPEGERTWKYSKLFCLPDVRLKLDDQVTIRNVRYRVMSLTGWEEYGYVEYDLTEDYRHEE